MRRFFLYKQNTQKKSKTTEENIILCVIWTTFSTRFSIGGKLIPFKPMIYMEKIPFIMCALPLKLIYIKFQDF